MYGRIHEIYNGRHIHPCNIWIHGSVHIHAKCMQNHEKLHVAALPNESSGRQLDPCVFLIQVQHGNHNNTHVIGKTIKTSMMYHCVIPVDGDCDTAQKLY